MQVKVHYYKKEIKSLNLEDKKNDMQPSQSEN